MCTTLIGLGCIARIGKDYAAAELARHWDSERIAFADELKKDLADVMKNCGFDYFELEKDPFNKDKLRPLLVSYGQTMREFDQDIWVKRAFADRPLTHKLTIVTDVRFPNEVEFIKKAGGVYIDIQANVMPANVIEAEYRGKMAKLADYKVQNDFNSKFITDLVSLVDDLIEGSKQVKEDILWKTQSNKSNPMFSTGELTSSFMLGQNLSFQRLS